MKPRVEWERTGSLMLSRIWAQRALHCLYWFFKYRILTSTMTSLHSGSVYGIIVRLVTGPGRGRRSIDFGGRVGSGVDGGGDGERNREAFVGFEHA